MILGLRIFPVGGHKTWIVEHSRGGRLTTKIYSLIIYLLYKIQNFCIPDMNTSTCLLSHHLYHIPFWNTSVFFMRITSRFFHLNAYDTNVIKGDTIRRFGVFYLNCGTFGLVYWAWFLETNFFLKEALTVTQLFLARKVSRLLQLFVCSFVWSALFHSRIFHLYWEFETSPLPMKGCKFWPNVHGSHDP